MSVVAQRHIELNTNRINYLLNKQRKIQDAVQRLRAAPVPTAPIMKKLKKKEGEFQENKDTILEFRILNDRLERGLGLEGFLDS